MPDTTSTATNHGGIIGWAEQLGQIIGQGVARGINSSLQSVRGLGGAIAQGVAGAPSMSPRKRGRPPKPFVGFVPANKRCKVAGCGKPARSKGLCSAHYQAARRKKLAKA
jgi:hypothetical protein